MSPSQYLGERLGEPNQQVILGGRLRYQNHSGTAFLWSASFRAEAEFSGSKQVLWDVDNTYIGRASKGGFPALYLGRVHPWTLSGISEELSPWGLASHRQTLDRGLQLGYGWGRTTVVPSPILIGWMGVHAWKQGERFSYGVSASPVYVPERGPSVDYAQPEIASRFARRPPSQVSVRGQNFPLQASVNLQNAMQNVVLHPQAMAHCSIQWSDKQRSYSWVSNAPAPEAKTNILQNYLSVGEDSAKVVAEVEPVFLNKWQFGWLHQYSFNKSNPWAPTIAITSLYEDPRWGVEIEVRNRYFGAGYRHQWQLSANDYLYSLANLSMWLPLGRHFVGVTLYTHSRTGDAWIHSGVDLQLSQQTTLGLGIDLFGGRDGSYFGEWRTNDRLFAMLRWQGWE